MLSRRDLCVAFDQLSFAVVWFALQMGENIFLWCCVFPIIGTIKGE